MHRRAGFTSAELLNMVVLSAILAAILLGRQQRPRLDGVTPAATEPAATEPAATTPAATAPLPAGCVAITPLDSARVAADTACRRFLPSSAGDPAR